MRWGERILFLLLAAATVVAVDSLYRSSLLDVLWPRILHPPDGAIVTPPVLVRWEGPRELPVTLLRGTDRIELGRRDTPFVIQGDRFPDDGQYRIEVRSPLFGGLSRSTREFLVRTSGTTNGSTPDRADRTPAPTPAQATVPSPELEREISIARRENALLHEENTRLRREHEELIDEIALLLDEQIELESELDTGTAELTTLAERLDRVRASNRRLLLELQSASQTCAVWGYMTQPRPQTVPPTRFVVVSDGSGRIFSDQADCERSRQGNPRSMSACTCIGRAFEP